MHILHVERQTRAFRLFLWAKEISRQTLLAWIQGVNVRYYTVTTADIAAPDKTAACIVSCSKGFPSRPAIFDSSCSILYCMPKSKELTIPVKTRGVLMPVDARTGGVS